MPHIHPLEQIGLKTDEGSIQGQVGLLRARSSNERKWNTDAKSLNRNPAATSIPSSDGAEVNNLRQLFRCVDLDQSGVIEKDEFVQVPRTLKEFMHLSVHVSLSIHASTRPCKRTWKSEG